MHDSPTESAPLCGSPAALAPSPRPARPKPTDRGGLGVLPVRGAVPLPSTARVFHKIVVFWFLFVDLWFQLPNRTIVFVSFLRKEFDTPTFELALPEFSCSFRDASVRVSNVIHSLRLLSCQLTVLLFVQTRFSVVDGRIRTTRTSPPQGRPRRDERLRHRRLASHICPTF